MRLLHASAQSRECPEGPCAPGTESRREGVDKEPRPHGPGVTAVPWSLDAPKGCRSWAWPGGGCDGAAGGRLVCSSIGDPLILGGNAPKREGSTVPRSTQQAARPPATGHWGPRQAAWQAATPREPQEPSPGSVTPPRRRGPSLRTQRHGSTAHRPLTNGSGRRPDAELSEYFCLR